jgi:tetratricopeptide (TPR) repeat protein
MKKSNNKLSSLFNVAITVITTLTLVMTFIYNSRIKDFEIKLLERQTSLSEKNFFANLMEKFLNGNECDRIISVELMKHVDDSLAYDLLEAIAKNDCSSKVKRKAIDVIKEKGIQETRKAIDQLPPLKVTEKSYTSKASTVLDRIIKESPEEDISTAQESKEKIDLYENLQIARVLLSTKKYEESIIYFQKAIHLVDDQSKLEKAAYVLAEDYFKNKEYEKAANQYKLTFKNFN